MSRGWGERDEAAEEASHTSIHIYSTGILLWEERNEAHSPHTQHLSLGPGPPPPRPGGQGRVWASP